MNNPATGKPDVFYVVDRPAPPPRSGGRGRKPETSLGAAIRGLMQGEGLFVQDRSNSFVSSIAATKLGRGNFVCRTEDQGVIVWRTA